MNLIYFVALLIHFGVRVFSKWPDISRMASFAAEENYLWASTYNFHYSMEALLSIHHTSCRRYTQNKVPSQLWHILWNDYHKRYALPIIDHLQNSRTNYCSVMLFRPLSRWPHWNNQSLYWCTCICFITQSSIFRTLVFFSPFESTLHIHGTGHLIQEKET